MFKRIFRFIYWTARMCLGWLFWALGLPFMMIGHPLWRLARICFGVKR